MTKRWLRLFALSAAVGFASISAGCETPRTPSGPTAPSIVPVGLEAKLEASRKDMLAPAAVVFVATPEGTWSKAFGTRSLDGGPPVTVNDRFRIGSNTKTMTATVVLQLVEEGLLRLDDPIAKFYPGIPHGDRITIAQLLEMRSGIPTYSDDVGLNRALDESPARAWSPEELVALALTRPPSFEPGAAYEYSNTNTVLLGIVIEQVTKRPVEDVLQERIFDRLRMHDTVMPRRGSWAIPGEHPRGYMFGTNVETIASQVFPPAKQRAAREGSWHPWDATDIDPSWGWTAGAAISTAPDLAKYAQALGTGELLGPEMQKKRMESFRPRDPASPAVTYGLGLAKVGPMIGHTGELPGFNSYMGYDPTRKIAVVTWTSLGAAPDGRAPAVELAKVVLGELATK